jgi:hypothetical protein
LSYALYVDAFPQSIKSFFSLLHWVGTMALHPTIKGAAVEKWSTYNHSYRDVTDSQFITCTVMALGHSLSNIFGEAVIESFRCDDVLNGIQPYPYPGSNLYLAVWVLLIGVHVACNFDGKAGQELQFAQTQHRVRITIGRFMTVVMIYEVDSDDEKGQHERYQIDDPDDPAQFQAVLQHIHLRCCAPILEKTSGYVRLQRLIKGESRGRDGSSVLLLYLFFVILLSDRVQ